MIELQKFIHEHEDWGQLLSQDPYNLHIRESDPYVLFKYDQIRSDMSLRICQESRGIILDSTDWSVACRPFDKFFNFQESLAADIDWNTARVQEKVDGSLGKIWFDKHNNEWHLSTNGSINAHEAEVMFPTQTVKNFRDLFMTAAGDWYAKNMDTLIKGFTYCIEIVGPHNRVVVPYSEPGVFHIGTRENSTGVEYDVDIGLPKPKLYDFTDVDAVLEYAKTMPYSEEGFVVVDANWNRVKIKSEEYVRIHRIRGEAIPTKKRILDIVRNNGSDDFLSYFPEYKETFDEVIEAYKGLIYSIHSDVAQYVHEGWDHEQDRKRYALEFAKNCTASDYMFQLKDGKRDTSDSAILEFLQEMQLDKLVRVLGLS